MPLDRVRLLVERFRAALTRPLAGDVPAGSGMDPQTGIELLESMLLARHLDVAAHELRAAGHGHYTICSSGHEANVVLGRLTRVTDPAILHYRSAAVQLERARQCPGVDPVRAIALSLVASSEEPTSGGRHKLFGSRPLGIIPSTSTIASHLPRAVGLGFAIERAARLGLPTSWPADAIALASFGDASLNHSTALGALNAAGWTLHQRLKLPVLFVCEDNQLGISVRTPEGWTGERLKALPHLRYFEADGTSLLAAHLSASEAVEYVRRTRRAAVLHVRCVRLLGHAGSDVDTVYRAPSELEQALARDPVLGAARELILLGALAPADVLALDRRTEARVRAEAERSIARPKLESRQAVMQAIVRPVPDDLLARATSAVSLADASPLTLAQGLNRALAEALERYPESLIFGEDVARKGGVYGVTKGLLARAGPARVFNTLLDEQTILGLALGAATLGLLPIPEIQYLAYLHNAEDQLRGEAATTQFFSGGAYDNPMLIRIAGLAYQKGFGGHFHNDDAIAVLRDIPGISLIVPARGDDALELYRTALALAKHGRRVVVALEPIALYHTRDLDDADGGWLASPSAAAAEFGMPRVYHPDAGDLVIASYGNGLWMSLRVARRLAEADGARARVLDLRWLSPLPAAEVLRHARECGRLLVVDECRKTGSPSEQIAAALLEAGADVRFARVTSADSFVPLGEAANLVLASESEIERAARELMSNRGAQRPEPRRKRA
jgi:2-oxoisovalerate dehydrogenase E1 component